MKSILHYPILLLAGFVLQTTDSAAQTCSCAGAPILSSLETGAAPAGSGHFGLSWQTHAINDLMDGAQKLDEDRARSRSSQSLILESSYGLTRNWSITGLLTLIRHERRSPSVEGSGERLITRGLGEGLLLLKYTPFRRYFPSYRELTLGAGGKFPLGGSARTGQGIVVAEDMQPSSGSLDGVLWGFFAQSLTADDTTNLHLTASYRRSGRNTRNYDTGDEFVATAGLARKLGRWLDGNLGLRYRWAASATRNGHLLPNTGGQWLSWMPGIGLQTRYGVTLRLAAQLPLHRRVEGVQFSTSYATTVSMLWNPN